MVLDGMMIISYSETGWEQKDGPESVNHSLIYKPWVLFVSWGSRSTLLLIQIFLCYTLRCLGMAHTQGRQPHGSTRSLLPAARWASMLDADHPTHREIHALGPIVC